jgi:hypothetical protein
MYRFFPVVLMIALFSCNGSAQGPAKITKPVEHIKPTREQAERRKQSEDYCKAHNVPVYSNQNALFVDTDDSVTTRTKEEVEDRALALMYIGLKSEGLDKVKLAEIDKKYGIVSHLSPEEKKYVFNDHPTEKQTVDAGWRYEGLHVMLWALGFIDSLYYPGISCNVAADVSIIHGLTREQFHQKAKLRTKKELLDKTDLLLRLNWACTDARINNKLMPGHLDSGVVQEWHYSLNWLIKYMGQNWDNVSTDT